MKLKYKTKLYTSMVKIAKLYTSMVKIGSNIFYKYWFDIKIGLKNFNSVDSELIKVRSV